MASGSSRRHIFVLIGQVVIEPSPLPPGDEAVAHMGLKLFQSVSACAAWVKERWDLRERLRNRDRGRFDD